MMSERNCAVSGCDEPAAFEVRYTDSDDGQDRELLTCRVCANDICDDCATTGMDFMAKTLPEDQHETIARDA